MNYAHPDLCNKADRDPKSNSVRKLFEKICQETGIPVTRLKRYAVENYFPVSALKEVFKGQIPNELTSIDPKPSMEKQTGMNVKKNNRRLAQVTTIDETPICSTFSEWWKGSLRTHNIHMG